MDSLKTHKPGGDITPDVILEDPGKSSGGGNSTHGRVLHAERDIGKLRIMQSDMDTMARYSLHRGLDFSM
jgi:hypothetical protein